MPTKIDKKIISILIFIIIIFAFLIVTKKISIKEVEEKDNLLKDNEIKNSIFGTYYDKSRILVSNMTIKEKIGQLFLVRYNKEDTEYLSNFYPGGYILFAKDLDKNSKEEMIEELKNVQNQNKYKLIKEENA